MNLKSRKLIFAAVAFGCATIALWLGHADFKLWSEFVMWTFGIYSVGNVGEHISNSLNIKK